MTEQNHSGITIKVVDSHRNLPEKYWTDLGRFYARNVWSQSAKISAKCVKDFCIAYELDYAVKWFELCAYKEKKLVGFMRVLRNPDVETHWFFCDVHTDKEERRQGVASAMYARAEELVKEFEAAECIEAGISARNVKSIGLHKKFGFENTGKKPMFAHFEFEPDETVYRKPLYLEYPALDGEMHGKILRRLFREYYRENGIEQPKHVTAFIRELLHSGQDFFLVWCGNRPVGFRYTKEGQETSWIRDSV